MDESRARFEAEVLPHLDAAYRLARWLARSSTEAEDVVQDALLRAFRGFGGLRGSDAKTWLLVIVKNCHLSAIKQHQRRATVPLPEETDMGDAHAMIAPGPGPEKVCMLRDETRTWERLTATLPAEQRTTLMLREMEEMDYAQIAAVTHVPIGTVMSRLARARAALKARWLAETEESSRAVR